MCLLRMVHEEKGYPDSRKVMTRDVKTLPAFYLLTESPTRQCGFAHIYPRLLAFSDGLACSG